MAIEAVITGNMLENPSQRVVPGARGETTVTSFRMMSDVWKETADGALVQDQQKSKPVAITIWNERLGNEVMRLFRAGMRVLVSGDLHLNDWLPTEAQVATGSKAQHELRCVAYRVSLMSNRVEAVTMRAKRANAAGGQPGDSGDQQGTNQAGAGYVPGVDADDIPF